MLPSAAGALSQVICEHVGVVVLDQAPVARHVTTSATPDASVKPSLHVYVSTVSYAPTSAVSAVPSTVRTPFVCAAGALAHVIAVHVGVVVLDHAPAAPHVTTSATPEAASL